MNTNSQFKGQSWRLLLAAILTFTSIYPSVLFADSPDAINYQGKLADNAGNPLTGIYPMTFEIYSAVTGGTLLVTDSRASNQVPVSNGIFNVSIGTGTIVSGSVGSIRAAMQSGTATYLQVNVNGTALLPRQRLVASPYALAVAQNAISNAEVASGAGITVTKLAAGTFPTGAYSFSASTVTFSGSGVWRGDGNLGIGTSSPSQKLHVVGDALISGLGGSGTQMVVVDNTGLLGTQGFASNAVTGTGSADRVAYWTTTSTISFTNSLSWINSTGRLGIGLSNPSTTLDVAGSMNLTGTITFSGPSTDITTVSGQDFAIMPNGVGQVGIGTTNPGYMLEVAGNLGLKSDGANTGLLRVGYSSDVTNPGYYAVYSP